MYISTVRLKGGADGVILARLIGSWDKRKDWPIIDEAQTAVFKDPVRTAL